MFLQDIHTRRIQELEDTVRNLRKLLGSREMEVKELTSQVSDLTEMNASVKEELELARNRAAPGSRGNLAEVSVQLRDSRKWENVSCVGFEGWVRKI